MKEITFAVLTREVKQYHFIFVHLTVVESVI